MLKMMIVLLGVGVLAVTGSGDLWSQEIFFEERYPDGILKVEWSRTDDPQVIGFKEFDPGGQLKSEGQYLDGKLHGLYKEYHLNQKVKLSMGFKNGKQDGEYQEFLENGTLIKKAQYRHDRLDGVFMNYYENGNVKDEIPFSHGEINGTVKSYLPDGSLAQEASYRNGRFNGRYTEYGRGGKPRMELAYSDGLRDGPYQVYDEQGRLLAGGNFMNDKLDGVMKVFYENGGLRYELVYQKGVVNGQAKEYAPDGTLITVDAYEHGEIQRQKKFNQDGTLIKEEMNVLGRWAIAPVTDFHIGLMILTGVAGMLLSYLLLRGRGTPQINRQPLTHNPQDGSPASSPAKELNPLHPETEKMCRWLIETVDSGVFMADKTGRLIYVNQPFAKMFGYYVKSEVIGLNIHTDLFKDRMEAESFDDTLRKKLNLQDYRVKNLSKDGQESILSVNANYLWNDRGEVLGIEGVVFDVTQRTKLENDLIFEKKKMDMILRFFEKIDMIRDQEQLADFVVKGVNDILEAEKCSLILQDKESKQLVIKGSQGIPDEIVKTTIIHWGEPIDGIVAKERKPLLVKNIELDVRFQRSKRSSYLGRSFIIVPMEMDGKLIGMINVSDKRSEVSGSNPFDEIDLRILSTIAGKVTLAVENVRLYEELNILTVTDPITQIYNYRLLSESLDHEFNRLKRKAGPLTVILIDIDNFKEYNDTYGHLEGDELLKGIGIILKNQLRAVDIVCRYAGDEFCVVLPDTDIEGARTAAEKIRQAVAANPFKKKVTMSLGVAGYQPGMTKKDLLQSADKALYQAKAEGRNRVVLMAEWKPNGSS